MAATPRQKPSSATTTPPGTALVRIIGNPNHTAATSERRLRCEAGTAVCSNSDSSSMPPTRSASALDDTDMGRSPPGAGVRGSCGCGWVLVLVRRARQPGLQPGVEDAERVHRAGGPEGGEGVLR